MCVGLPYHCTTKRRTIRRIQPPGQGLALATCRRQRMGRDAICAPGRIEKYHLLIALAPGRAQIPVPGFKTQCDRVNFVPFCSPRPAALGQHNRNRLTGNQFGLVHDLSCRAFNDCSPAIVSMLCRIGQKFVANQLLDPDLTFQNLL